MVSAKQRAARAKFAYRMKHGGFRKHRTHAHTAVSHVRHRTRVSTMARRRHGRHRSRGLIGGFSIMKGFAGRKIPMGILGQVAAGYLYTRFVSASVPKFIPMQSALTESAVIGGIPMAAGSLLAGANLGSGTGNANY